MTKKAETKAKSDTQTKAKVERAEISPSTPGLEWAVSGLGVAIVTTMLAFIGYNGLKEERTPPDVTVKILGVRPVGQGVLVQIRAKNNGASTAAGLTIEGVVKEGEKDLETSNVTFDYLPAHSTRDGGVYFTKDAAAHRIEVRALGYQMP